MTETSKYRSEKKWWLHLKYNIYIQFMQWCDYYAEVNMAQPDYYAEVVVPQYINYMQLVWLGHNFY